MVFSGGTVGREKAAENIVLFEKGAGPALVNVAHRPDGVESAAPIVNVDERFRADRSAAYRKGSPGTRLFL